MRPLEIESEPGQETATIAGLPLFGQEPGAQSGPLGDGDSPATWVPLPLEQVRLAAGAWAESGVQPLVYEVWKQFGGKSRFFCRGRCVTGPPVVDFKFNVAAWFLVVVPTAFYMALCAPAVWRHEPLLPVCTAALWATTAILMLLTSFTDPGIIPRPAQQLLTESLGEDVAHAVGAVGVPLDAELRPTQSEFDRMMDRLSQRGYSWCRYCQMLQPPRAKHCRDCDSCILRIDHHCPFVNNCIGQRNYVYFCGFLLSTSCLSAAVFAGVLHWLSLLSDNAPEDKDDPLAFLTVAVLGVITALVVLGVAGLGLFHAALILTGRTTREVLRPRGVPAHGATLCGFRGPSLIPTRQRVQLRTGRRESATSGGGPTIAGGREI